MSFLDRLKDGVTHFLPPKSGPGPMSTSMSGGIGGGHGMVPFEDDMIVSKPAIIFHSSQIFFNFLAMACFASVASFQAHWKVGPSGLSGFAIFITVSGMFLSLFMLMVPVIYEKYDKLTRLARALKEVRVAFILTGAGVVASLLIAFIVTISAWTEPGCKNPDNDPNQHKGDDFKNGLSGWCSTKKAGAVFLWLAFGFWLASSVLLVLDWRSGKTSRPRDPPFTHPPSEHDLDDEGDEESSYHQIPPPRRPTVDNSNSFNSPFADPSRHSSAPSASTGGFGAPAASRQSMDVYGAFSDPPPSGFGGTTPSNGSASTIPPAGGQRPADPYSSVSDLAPSGFRGVSPTRDPVSDSEPAPRMSRTMQYADPYAAVRASIAGTNGGAVSPTRAPPSYESYQGYR